jgi:myo-inositol-1(or 4)-monophosphatase
MPFDSDLDLAITAARGAGAILRAAFGTGLAVAYKAVDQPVTEADREADDFLRAALLGARPDYGWISEESLQAADGSKGGSAERVWVVDPLDGTANFIADRPEFAVCIGLLVSGKPVLGVIYDPMTEDLYHATEGRAFRSGVPIRVAPAERGRQTLVVSPAELARGVLAQYTPGWTVVEIGSTALKMMRVADGRAHAYVSVVGKGVWDVCGGSVIAEAAGAQVTTLAGEPIDYSDGFFRVRGLVVAPAPVAATLRELSSSRG